MSTPDAPQPEAWQNGLPPNEVVVEAKDHDGKVLRVKAVYRRDGYLPHWRSEDDDTHYEASYFGAWRKIPDLPTRLQALIERWEERKQELLSLASSSKPARFRAKCDERFNELARASAELRALLAEAPQKGKEHE